jgi:hypothetical protein
MIAAMLRPHATRPIIALLIACALGLILAPTVPGQPKRQPGTNVGLNYPGRTDAGEWDGTWYYVNRGERWVIWIRTRADGLPELKMRYMNVDKAESFSTDWTPEARYSHRTLQGSFRIDISERDSNLIKGAWRWELGAEGREMHRTESGGIVLYRGAEGRSLVMLFEGFERVYKTPTDEVKLNPRLSMTFVKASRRQAHWEELPF